jgi:hypothetical protein
MTYKLILFLVIYFVITPCLWAQNASKLTIKKIKGSYNNAIKLPADLRIVKYDENRILLKLDSISNGFFYGNKGQDSILISEIKAINTRGLKEYIKYPIAATFTAISFGAAIFTIYAFNYPLDKCDGNGGCNNEIYPFIGMGYMGTFGLLATTFYLLPKTKFNSRKYNFSTN